MKSGENGLIGPGDNNYGQGFEFSNIEIQNMERKDYCTNGGDKFSINAESKPKGCGIGYSNKPTEFPPIAGYSGEPKAPSQLESILENLSSALQSYRRNLSEIAVINDDIESTPRPTDDRCVKEKDYPAGKFSILRNLINELRTVTNQTEEEIIKLKTKI